MRHNNKLRAAAAAAAILLSGQAQANPDHKGLADVLSETAVYESLGLEPQARAKILSSTSKSPAFLRLAAWTRLYDSNMRGEPEGKLPGAVSSFLVSFPYESASLYDFGQPFSPERDGFDTSQASSGAMYPALSWTAYETKGNAGAVRPKERMASRAFTTLYLAARISVPEAKDAYLEVPSSGPIIAWVNGQRSAEEIHSGPEPAPLFGSRHPIRLNAGENILVFKVGTMEHDAAFYVFLSDAKTGQPLDFSTDNSTPIQSGPLGEKLEKKPLPSILAEIIDDASIPAPKRALIARQSLAEDDAERETNRLLMPYIEGKADASIDDIEMAILSISAPSRGMILMNRYIDKYRGNPRFDLLYARLQLLVSEDAGDRGTRFSAEWREMKKKLEKSVPTEEGRSYEIQRRKILALAELNSQQSHMAMKDADLASCPECDASLLPMFVSAMTQDGDIVSYRESVEKLFSQHKSASAYLADLLDMKLRRAVSSNDEATLNNTLSEIQKSVEHFFMLHPYDDHLWEFWLGAVSGYGLDAPGMTPERQDRLREAGFTADAESWYLLYLTQRVNDPHRWLIYAEHCIKTGAVPDGISAYEMAAKLEPQNESISERADILKRSLNPDASASDSAFEKPYIIENIPTNSDATANGIVSLLDNRVVKVFPNGLSSTFSQIAFEVIDEQGIKAARRTPINYSPTDQKLEIISVTTQKKDGSIRRLYYTSEYNLADESVRMYYDQRQMVIEIPDLAVGDIVEYRFKRTQMQRTSGSVVFFSDLYQLQTWFNRQWSKYTIIAPSSMHVHIAKSLPGGKLEETPIQTKTADGQTVSMYEEKNTRRLLPEDKMPGTTEVMPVLLISTFNTWDEFAAWYRDLAEPQWKIDAALRSAVHQLTDGIVDPLEKLKRIHSYVVKQTRYVALEFGVHGYKPYPVTQVFERRFGDCKDKASLLKVMLEEAGIETSFVLVRTRSNGRVSLDHPNPYLFDHAIAYVPQFDLFLDGTAEFSGTKEIPVMDQDAEVFILNNDGSYTLRNIPVSRAEDNISQHTWVFDLSQGERVFYTDEGLYQGMFAPSYRERYQIENLQRERMESELAYSIPGTKVESVQFNDLGDLETNVTYQLKASTGMSDIVKRDGNRWLINPIVSASRMTPMFAPSASRRTPLMLISPLTMVQTATLILPAGAQAHIPADVHIQSKFGEYSINAKQQGNQLTTQVMFKLTQLRIQPSDYPDYLDFIQSFDRRLNTQYAIEVNP